MTARSRLPLCADPNALVPEVMAEWQALASEEPWHTLPNAHRFDSLPDLVAGLLDASVCQPNDRAAYRAKLEAAATHGSTRRTQGFAHDLLLTEHYLLREAIWRVLRRRYPDDATTLVLRVDSAVTAATRASLHGFHRAEIERAGRWPAVIDELADGSPLVEQAG